MSQAGRILLRKSPKAQAYCENAAVILKIQCLVKKHVTPTRVAKSRARQPRVAVVQRCHSTRHVAVCCCPRGHCNVPGLHLVHALLCCAAGHPGPGQAGIALLHLQQGNLKGPQCSAAAAAGTSAAGRRIAMSRAAPPPTGPPDKTSTNSRSTLKSSSNRSRGRTSQSITACVYKTADRPQSTIHARPATHACTNSSPQQFKRQKNMYVCSAHCTH